jgi:hypothetical protein
LDQLSPPEAEHVLLELPAEREQYLGLVADVTGWPERTPLSRRVPAHREVAALKKALPRWRAMCLLDDEPAMSLAATLFSGLYLLDPLYDSGELLYAAWHDPNVKAEHTRRLAEHAGLLVRAGPLLRDGVAVLAPDHLPGSWDPRPGWRRPKPDADPSMLRGWALRTALVLLNWADRLDAVVVVAREDVAAALPVALGLLRSECPVRMPSPNADPPGSVLAALSDRARALMRRRNPRMLPALACVLSEVGGAAEWRLVLGEPTLADPALLLRRVLNGTDPHRMPPLPPTPLKRRPLCLLPQAPPESRAEPDAG